VFGVRNDGGLLQFIACQYCPTFDGQLEEMLPWAGLRTYLYGAQHKVLKPELLRIE